MGGAVGKVARRRPLLFFFVAAWLLNWLLLAPLILSPAGLGLITTPIPYETVILGATTPTLAALLTQWLTAGNLRICRIGGPWGAVAGGILLGTALVLLAFAVAPALVLTGGAVGALRWAAIVEAAIGWFANPLNLLGGPLNEEPGWRGFALPRLQARYGPLIGTLLLGLGWAFWHLPLFLVQGWLTVPLWTFVVTLLCMSVLMTFAANAARMNIVPAILMHAIFNFSFAILVGLCRGVETIGPGLPIYVGSAVGVTLLVILATRGRLGAPAATASAGVVEDEAEGQALA
jgi:membrane protease YdiL (CAAX protease family)